MGSTEKDFLGVCSLIDITGAVAQVNLPASVMRFRDPINNSYFGSIGNSSYPQLKAFGKLTPTVMIGTYVKRSFFTGALIQRLVQLLDSVGDTHTFAVGAYQRSKGAWRTYEGCKCNRVDLMQEASGGPIQLQLFFDAISGDIRDAGLPAATTFSLPTANVAVDPGQVLDCTATTFLSTADLVHSWRLTLIRGQAPQDYFDQTRYCFDIASTAFSGVFSLTQSALATNIPTTGATVKMFTQASGTSAVRCDLLLSQDEVIQDKGTGLASITTTWSLFDGATGGNPSAFSDIA